MADDDNPATTATVTTEVEQETATTEPAKTYSQAEVDALVQKTKDSTWADARRMNKPKRQEEVRQVKDKTSDTKGGDQDRYARQMAQRDALDDVLGDKPITASKRRQLRDLLTHVDPDEPHAWLESFAEEFLSGAPTEKPTNNPSSETSVSQKKPGDVPGPSLGAPVWERPTDPFKWSEAQIAELVALKGARAANQIIRQKAEAFARTMRIQMAPQRR